MKKLFTLQIYTWHKTFETRVKSVLSAFTFQLYNVSYCTPQLFEFHLCFRYICPKLQKLTIYVSRLEGRTNLQRENGEYIQKE